MQKIAVWIVLFLSAAGQMGCVDDKTAEATIKVKATWGAQPYVLYSNQLYSNGNYIKLNEVMFFMSDITLVSDNKEALLTDIALVTLSKNHTTLGGAEVGETISGKNKVPALTYKTLRFGLGVSPALNAKKPEDFESTHPLGDPGYFWAADKYVFSRFAGIIRPNTTAAGQAWGYHTGTNELYRTVTVAIPPTALQANQNTDIVLTLDLQKIFINGTDTLALGTKSMYQDPKDATERPFLLDWNNRLAGAFR